MKRIIAALATLASAASIVMATEAPGNETTDRILPQVSDAVVGVFVSSFRTNEPGNHVLLVTVRTQRQLWGTATNGVFEAKHREFTIPAIREGMSVCFANYTGSGIEFAENQIDSWRPAIPPAPAELQCAQPKLPRHSLRAIRPGMCTMRAVKEIVMLIVSATAVLPPAGGRAAPWPPLTPCVP